MCVVKSGHMLESNDSKALYAISVVVVVVERMHDKQNNNKPCIALTQTSHVFIVCVHVVICAQIYKRMFH